MVAGLQLMADYVIDSDVVVIKSAQFTLRHLLATAAGKDAFSHLDSVTQSYLQVSYAASAVQIRINCVKQTLHTLLKTLLVTLSLHVLDCAMSCIKACWLAGLMCIFGMLKQASNNLIVSTCMCDFASYAGVSERHPRQVPAWQKGCLRLQVGHPSQQPVVES